MIPTTRRGFLRLALQAAGVAALAPFVPALPKLPEPPIAPMADAAFAMTDIGVYCWSGATWTINRHLTPIYSWDRGPMPVAFGQLRPTEITGEVEA